MNPGAHDVTDLQPNLPPVELISVNVAEPEIIGKHRGHDVSSAIRKRRVVSDGTLILTATNLGSDRQADLRVHGGPDKAVYAYPSEHIPAWNTELEPETAYGPGTFGENLSTRGWLEAEVRIGDVWQWGDALLQVCQPRYPCYKLSIATGRPIVGKRMLATGRNGWYLRVLRPGEVPVSGPIAVVERGPDPDVTVLAAAHAMLPDGDREHAARIADFAALAASWRDMIHDRLQTL